MEIRFRAMGKRFHDAEERTIVSGGVVIYKFFLAFPNLPVPAGKQFFA
jgi:hypothetical protein